MRSKNNQNDGEIMLEDKHFLLVIKISKGRVEQCNYFPWARISAYIAVLGQVASMKVIMIACINTNVYLQKIKI